MRKIAKRPRAAACPHGPDICGKIIVSVTKRIAFAAAASWFSRGVTIVLALVLMPVLFHHLAKEELGIWLLLSQGSALLFIFDPGFGPTLSRRIALAKGKSGSDPNAPLNEETLREIADLVASGIVKPHVQETFPLEEASRAMAAVEHGGAVGKIVLLLE